MSLSTSRQQFLTYETQSPEDIHYNRKGGIFVSTCVCVTCILLSVVLAAVVGVIVYFITYFKISHSAPNAEFWDETKPFGNLDASPNLRLPSSVVPSFYRLKLHTDLENSNFTGEVYITIRANKPVKEIILHSKDLTISDNAKLTEQKYERVGTLHQKFKREIDENATLVENSVNVNNESLPSIDTVGSNATTKSDIPTNTESVTQSVTIAEVIPTNPIKNIDTQVTHSSVRNIKIVSISADTGDLLKLKLATSLATNMDYTLQLSFSGNISNGLTGFYQSTYTDKQQNVKKLGVTQFEPTSARAAFPCFDEPAFKATFEISIAHPQNITVLSNMNVSTKEPILEEPGWEWTHFDRSVKMSTYLVAYILSDFKSMETTYLSKDNVTKTVRVWASPEQINNARYALNITPRLLSYYEDVFGVPYALDKLDLIAIPDFSSGAMENWGLITFRETTLLYDEESGVPRLRQAVAVDVAHELAHQWFGNLVTMRWWTDLWLNEGFATYVEFLGVNYIEPKWNILDTFVRDKMDLLRNDALKNTSPVSRQVIDASEISQKFDEISYNKGANLIRMLNHTISEALFRKGLLLYLNEWKYANAEENDLWRAMTLATATDPAYKDVSVVEFMNSWTRQAGYPVVNVNRNYETGTVEIEQKLFSSAQDPYKIMVDQLWHVPISYTTINSPSSEWTTKPKLWLKNRRTTLNVPVDENDAIYVNVDAIGYYRVNYDQKNWEMLSAALKSGQIQTPIAKAQLIDDAFNLAKVGLLHYNYALGLTTCVIDGEDSRIVWEMLLNNMGFLRNNLKATSGYVYFMDYINIILANQLKRVNYGLDKPKDDNEAFLIENLLTWECYAQSTRCIRWAKQQFHSWMNQTDIDDNPIPSYLRPLVYNVALKYGGRSEFDFLWRVFQESVDPNVKSLAINSLPSTREHALLTMLLEKSLDDIPKHYAVAVWAMEAPEGTHIAQTFLEENFPRVIDRFVSIDAFSLPIVLNYAFRYINDARELQRLKSLALNYKEKLLPMSQTLQKLIDTASSDIAWMDKYADGINAWFKNYVTNSTSSNKSTTKTDDATPTTTQSPSSDSGTGNTTVVHTAETQTSTSTTESSSANIPDLTNSTSATTPTETAVTPSA